MILIDAIYKLTVLLNSVCVVFVRVCVGLCVYVCVREVLNLYAQGGLVSESSAK